MTVLGIVFVAVGVGLLVRSKRPVRISEMFVAMNDDRRRDLAEREHRERIEQ